MRKKDTFSILIYAGAMSQIGVNTLKYDFKALDKQLKAALDTKRYTHSIGVMYTAICMAMRYEYDLEKAQIAGFLHDLAKCIPDTIQLSCCKEYNLPINEYERVHPYMLHAKLGAYLANRNYNITDQDILNAIESHTTGHAHMTTLEKIIFIADYIEPSRDKAPNLQEARKLAFIDLDKAILFILNDTILHLESKGEGMDMETKAAYEYYYSLQKKD